MLGPNPTHEHFRLSAYYLTDLTFQASGVKPLAWGEFMERYTAMYPPWTARPPGRPGDGLYERPTSDPSHLRLRDNPERTIDVAA
jgi:hypothetical protein